MGTLSKHARTRMYQRGGGKTKRRQTSEFNIALRRGYSPGDFKDCSFKQFLIQRSHGNPNIKVKVHGCNIYIYASRNKKAITFFKIPDEYKDYKKYLISPPIPKISKGQINTYNENNKELLQELENIIKYFDVKTYEDIENIIIELYIYKFLLKEKLDSMKEENKVYKLINKKCNYLNNSIEYLTGLKNKILIDEKISNRKIAGCKQNLNELIKFIRKSNISIR